MIVDMLAWVSLVLLLSAYAKGGRIFDWANAVLAVPVALPALLVGAYPTAAVSLCFGVIGTVRLLRHRPPKPYEWTTNWMYLYPPIKLSAQKQREVNEEHEAAMQAIRAGMQAEFDRLVWGELRADDDGKP